MVTEKKQPDEPEDSGVHSEETTHAERYLSADDYPDLSPELRAIFEKNWKTERGRQALRYLAEH